MSAVAWKDVPTRTVDVGGTEFAYRDLGPRTELPVTFLHHFTAGAGFDSYQRFTERQIPVAVLERRAG